MDQSVPLTEGEDRIKEIYESLKKAGLKPKYEDVKDVSMLVEDDDMKAFIHNASGDSHRGDFDFDFDSSSYDFFNDRFDEF